MRLPVPVFKPWKGGPKVLWRAVSHHGTCQGCRTKRRTLFTYWSTEGDARRADPRDPGTCSIQCLLLTFFVLKGVRRG